MSYEKTRVATGAATRADTTVAVHSGAVTLTPPHARGILPSSPAAQGYPNSGSEGSVLNRTPRPRAGKGGGIPDAEERHVLERSLGAALRALRAEAGMTQGVLGLRSGVARRSVEDLEAGRRRPSLAMLRALAAGSMRRLPPGPRMDPSPTAERLVSAAGASLVADSPGGVRRRERRLRDAGHAYDRACAAWWRGELLAAQRAELAFVSWVRLIEVPGGLDDAAVLEAAQQQRATFSTWLAQERPGPFGTTSAFFKMARSHGYPVRRRGRAA